MRYLRISVLDARAIRRRQPLWKRCVLRLTISWSTIQIWQGLLDVPADELAQRIRRYVEAHAPAGWFGREDNVDTGDTQDTDDCVPPAQ